jgi:hypothetical protein
MWSQLEAIHAVTYFASESIDAARSAGLQGFWMGYFGFRAAPLGSVSAGVVEAVFANFAPSMVRRSIPDAWTFSSPSDLVRIRARAAGTALRRVSPSIERNASRLVELLEPVIAAATPIGRPLFAANSEVGQSDDPVEQLWQQCTTLREHRGDGHVAALVAAGIDGCEAHLLAAATRGWESAVFFDNRGWTSHQQDAARQRLAERDLLDDDGITHHGTMLSASVEEITDVLAAAPFEQALDEHERSMLSRAIGPVARSVVDSDTIPFPNPMGLPRRGIVVT